MILEAIQADITTLDVDAIVNAANTGLIPGSGVDGAIRRAAGPELTRATAQIGGCPTGEAVITPGFRLKARWVIHTAAPVYGQQTEQTGAALLTACYRNALALAGLHGIATIAFPSLGTGIYGNPIGFAAPLAIAAVRAHLAEGGRQSQILFCLFSEADFAAYKALLSNEDGTG